MEKRNRPPARRLLPTVLSALGIAAGALLARALVEPRFLTVERLDVEVPHLPASLTGKRVALLADLHIGLPLGSRAAARAAVRRLLDDPPDLVLLAGDFVHDTRDAVGEATRLVAPLVAAGLPVCAVLGNHDYAMPTSDSSADHALAGELSEALQACGVRVLENERVALACGGDGRLRLVEEGAWAPDSLHLVGIGAHTPGNDCPERAFAGLPSEAPRIVLMHHPRSFAVIPAHQAPLALAAHTHGGQVRVPYFRIWRYLSYRKEIDVFVAGWVASGLISEYGEAGNRLYITRGVGCSVAPVRLFCPPELTLLTLRRGASRSS